MSRETDDYLWDGYGEPDPEIQELENLLGPLRHKGDAPRLPSNAEAKSFYKFAPMLAIAASVLFVIGAGIWLMLHRQSPAPLAGNPPVIPHESGSKEPASHTDDLTAQTINSGGDQSSKVNNGPNAQATYTVSKKRHYIALNPALQGLTPEEIKEGREAKAQLMLAMQIASSKLNQAKKRVQEDGQRIKS